MFCKNCGESLNENQEICLKCGVKVGGGNAYCANCGQAIDPNADVCLSCGAAVKKADSQYLNGKDKIVMAVLAFFLGGIGIHNFLLGETKKGIVKIVLSLCCGIGGILALIDMLKILLDKYVVEPDKLF